MKYEVDRGSDEAGEPSIEEMTEKAIRILQKNPKGYFLLVEGLSQHCYTPIKVIDDDNRVNDQKHQFYTCVIVVLMRFIHFIAVLYETLT